MLFYLLLYLIVYGSTFVTNSYLKTSHVLLYLTTTIGTILVGMFLAALLILKLNNEKLTLSVFGIRRDNLGNSFFIGCSPFNAHSTALAH